MISDAYGGKLRYGKVNYANREPAKNATFPQPALATRHSKKKKLLRQRGGYSCWPGYKPSYIFGRKKHIRKLAAFMPVADMDYKYRLTFSGNGSTSLSETGLKVIRRS